ncbi:MAG TPA: hypothetical protein VIL48_05095 [Acidimicrobiales bacterium]
MAVAVGALAAGCSGGSDGGDVADVGALEPVAGGGGTQLRDVVNLAGVDPRDLDLAPGAGQAVAVGAGPDGAVWLLVGGVSRSGTGIGPLALEVAGDRVSPAPTVEDAAPGAGVAVAGDGTVVLADGDQRELVRYRDGEVARVRPAGVAEVSLVAVGPDGTAYVADRSGGRVVAVAPDDGVATVVDGAYASALSVGPDGTVHYVDQDTGAVRSVAPGGEPRTVSGQGSAEPADGEPARGSSLNGTALAAADDGLYVLSANEVWRIDGDGVLHLEVRRGEDAALTALAAAGDRVYVFDEASGTLSLIGGR